jgi:uncharacterized protein YegP (UPF0339 family)
MSEHVKIMTDSAIVINHKAQLLEEQGIASIVKNNTESARLAGFGSFSDDVELFVSESDVEKAIEVLKKKDQ